MSVFRCRRDALCTTKRSQYQTPQRDGRAADNPDPRGGLQGGPGWPVGSRPDMWLPGRLTLAQGTSSLRGWSRGRKGTGGRGKESWQGEKCKHGLAVMVWGRGGGKWRVNLARELRKSGWRKAGGWWERASWNGQAEKQTDKQSGGHRPKERMLFSK